MTCIYLLALASYSDRKENPVAAAARQPPPFSLRSFLRIRRLLVFTGVLNCYSLYIKSRGVATVGLRDAVVVSRSSEQFNFILIFIFSHHIIIATAGGRRRRPATLPLISVRDYDETSHTAE